MVTIIKRLGDWIRHIIGGNGIPINVLEDAMEGKMERRRKRLKFTTVAKGNFLADRTLCGDEKLNVSQFIVFIKCMLNISDQIHINFCFLVDVSVFCKLI